MTKSLRQKSNLKFKIDNKINLKHKKKFNGNYNKERELKIQNYNYNN